MWRRKNGERTLGPDVSTGSDGEDEKERNKEERLEVVGGNRLSGENHSPDELTLTSPETSPQYDSEASTVGSSELVLRVDTGSLEDLRSAEKDGVAVDAVNVETVGSRAELDRLLEEGGGLAGEHSLVDDAGTAKEEKVAGRARILLGAN
jgi:hypothetical protein